MNRPDPLAVVLDEVTKLVGEGRRPRPTTIAALRRVNGALARQMREYGFTPEKYDEPFTGQPETPPEPEPPTRAHA
jgi:hypothetical protein